METLSQSTYLPLDAQIAWSVLSQTPRSFPLGRSNPSLVYIARNGLRVGAVVEMALHFGIHRLDWKATVVAYSPVEQTLELRLAEPTFLLDFQSHHQIVPFGDGACILREKIQFRAKEPGLQALFQQSSLMHAVRERMIMCGMAVSDAQDTAYGLSAVSELG